MKLKFNTNSLQYVEKQGFLILGTLTGITLYLEMQKETNLLKQANFCIHIKDEDENPQKFECQKIDLDEETIESLLARVDN